MQILIFVQSLQKSCMESPHLEQNAFQEAQGPPEVHEISHTLRLPTEHGSVGAKAPLKLLLC